mgnify:CR=1 FL=1
MLDFDREQLRKRLKTSMPEMSERERKILDHRFGLTDQITHTLEETGRIFGVTRERIRQIEHKAIDKIAENFDITSKEPENAKSIKPKN